MSKKDKTDKKGKKGKSSKKRGKAQMATASPAKAARGAGKGIAKLAKNPIVIEIVAATLVAAAAAMRDPKKAKALAETAGQELKSLTSLASSTGSSLWTVAKEVARRSVETLSEQIGEASESKSGDSVIANPAEKVTRPRKAKPRPTR